MTMGENREPDPASMAGLTVLSMMIGSLIRSGLVDGPYLVAMLD
jgi:hypothetical protein